MRTFYYDGKGFNIPPFVRPGELYYNVKYLLKTDDGRLMTGASEDIRTITAGDTGLRAGPPPSKKTSLNCFGLAKDSKGAMWAVINEGLCPLITRPGDSVRFSTNLPPITIAGKSFSAQALAFDGRDNLWTAGNGFLVAYLRQPGAAPYDAGHLLVFSNNDIPGALQGDNAVQLYPETAGNIIIARNGKAFSLNADSLIVAATQAPLPRLRLAGVSQNEAPVMRMEGLRFADSVNRIAFDWSVDEPLNAEYVNYEYRLAGERGSWISNGASGHITFNELPPGRYTLQVQATDLGGRQSEIASLPFSIAPPWYRSWWAWALWAALGAGLVALLFVARVRAARRKAAVERLIVEQQLKALRAQINPHFLQNTFAFLVNTLEEQPLPYSIEVINQLSAYLRNVLYRSDAAVMSMEDEIAFAGEYLAMNQLLLEGAFTYKIDVEDGLDTYNVKVPSMLLQPLLENAIKHRRAAGGGRPAEIAIRVYADERSVYCTISNPADAGREPQAPGYLPKGLELTKQRLLLLYREAGIMAGEEGGSYLVIVRMPLLYHKEATPVITQTHIE